MNPFSVSLMAVDFVYLSVMEFFLKKCYWQMAINMFVMGPFMFIFITLFLNSMLVIVCHLGHFFYILN